MPFSIYETAVRGLLVVEPRIFTDERGFFMESYKRSDFEKIGITQEFVQDNHSRSSKGTVRGLHFQRDPYAQGKLVRVTNGRVWDVAVDLRRASPTFGTWHGVELSNENRLMFWIPAGFANGFIALDDGSELQYKCSSEYHAESDYGIRWNDPTLAITWPDTGREPVLSDKDARLPLFDASTNYF